MPSRVHHRRQEEFLGVFQPRGFLHSTQVTVHFAVFLDERVTLPDLFETMLQRSQKKIVLGIRVRLQHRFEQGGHGFDLSQQLQTGNSDFEMIE